jgi:hypothetical protein
MFPILCKYQVVYPIRVVFEGSDRNWRVLQELFRRATRYMDQEKFKKESVPVGYPTKKYSSRGPRCTGCASWLERGR